MKKFSLALVIMLVILALMVATLGAEAAMDKSPRIMHGHDAVEGQVPWHVSQRPKRADPVCICTDHCAGSIIHPRWVLTAAHCVLNYQIGKKVLVYATLDLVDKGWTRMPGRLVEVDTMIMHPNYVPKHESTYEYDLALYHTAEPLVLNHTDNNNLTGFPMARSVRLAGTRGDDFTSSVADPPVGTRLQVAGWGLSHSGAMTRLQVVELRVGDHGQCVQAYGTGSEMVTDKVLCCDNTAEGLGPCNGDSGSGLVWVDPPTASADADPQPVLVAVTSFGKANTKCRDGVPSCFVRVAPHIDWIRSIVPDI